MSASEDVDVLIVGAGISGIGAARHLLHRCPGRTFTILEGRDDIGGTWDLFRYPGVRSDSDMHTLGYEFRPWVADDAIADGPAIMQYLRDTVAEEGIGPRIRFGHRVTRAEWVGEDARWTVRATGPDGSEVVFTANFLFVCAGYYSYRHGYTPDIPGLDRFSGPVIHPQEWPEDLEVAGKRIVVIGSGATAMTLVPALAERGATVTMLQRSPSYVVSRPRVDRVAIALRRVLPAKLAYRITRLKNTTMQQFFYERARRRPQEVKTYLVGKVAEALPGMDVEKHFTPSYAPWDQRVCLVPDGDLFDAIRSGRVEVVTDTIDHVDATGIVAGSGTHLDADILITATGLELVTLGEIAFTVDGEPVDFGQTWSYKGLAYSDVPNLASSFGYVNASWTLRTDLICGYVCRLLDYMDRTGTRTCTPRLRPSDAAMTPRPWVDGFTPGYITRHLDRMPRQGDREPWINPQNYARDRKLFAKAPVDDGVMQFR